MIFDLPLCCCIGASMIHWQRRLDIDIMHWQRHFVYRGTAKRQEFQWLQLETMQYSCNVLAETLNMAQITYYASNSE